MPDNPMIPETQASIDLSFYQQVVDRHRQQIMARDGVQGFGIGYRTIGDLRTKEICLIVEVASKTQKVSADQKIPAMIDSIPTDVIETNQWLEGPETRPSPQAAGPLTPEAPRIPNVRSDVLIGGLGIRNPNISRINAGVLAAVVFDLEDDRPLGLSVQHAIGNDDVDDRAQPGDPINQPMSQDAQDKVGTLLKFDPGFDAALFKIEDRNYVAKVRGKSEDFELGEPVLPKIGMRVECLGRLNYATGKIVNLMYRILSGKVVHQFDILFDPGSRTDGGDSGAVWVETDSRRPVGLHQRFYSRYTDWRSGQKGTAALATSVEQLATKWHKFAFTHPKFRHLAGELNSFQTSFAQWGQGFVAFCQKPGIADPLVIKRFSRKAAKQNHPEQFVKDQEVIVSDLFPKRGFGIAALNTIQGEPDSWAFWRETDYQLWFAKLGPQGTTLIDRGKFGNRKTFHKPAAVSFNRTIVVAFTDLATRQVKLITLDAAPIPSGTQGGANWSVVRTNFNTQQAPALAVYQDKLILVYTSASNTHLKIVTLKPKQNTYEMIRHESVLTPSVPSAASDNQPHSTIQSPTLTTGEGKLYLAYTSYHENVVRILESDDGESWSISKVIDTNSKASPTLFYFPNKLGGGDLICSQQESDTSWNSGNAGR